MSIKEQIKQDISLYYLEIFNLSNTERAFLNKRL